MDKFFVLQPEDGTTSGAQWATACPLRIAHPWGESKMSRLRHSSDRATLAAAAPDQALQSQTCQVG